MFYDQVTITVTSGKGGDGAATMRREAFVPRGGPDGGDGGRGGNVILIADKDLNTLLPFRYKKNFAAGDGGDGAGQRKHGKVGAHLYLKVPPGTVVRDVETNDIMADLVAVGDQAIVAEGGRGGLGNTHFVTATFQAPHFADKGEKGEERALQLELKLVADVGVIGYPNVGKSTLLASVSAARPKIADYPFTTITPNLGVVSVGEDSFVMVDVPGLIEGAHEGKGLGLAFLRHAERTRLLVHVVDGLADDPLQDIAAVNNELALYAADLKDKAQLIAVNKMDLTEVRERWPELHKKLAKQGYTAFAISAATGLGVSELMHAVNRQLRALPIHVGVPSGEAKIFRPQSMDAFTVSNEGAVFVVRGRRAERIVETADLDNEYALLRVMVLLRRLGVAKSLMAAGVKPGDLIRFGQSEIVWDLDDEKKPLRHRRKVVE
jgi:GTP-binding protein